MLERLLELCAGIVFTASANPRALPARRARRGASTTCPQRVAARVEADPRRALAVARELAGPGGVVLATGSIYLVADLMRPAGRRTGVDAVSEKGPSALVLIAAVAIIVALVILVFFAVGYGLGRLLL